MNLNQYLDKNVFISSINGKTFTGYVDDYYYPDENESGKESIVILTKDKKYIEFTEEDITDIKII